MVNKKKVSVDEYVRNFEDIVVPEEMSTEHILRLNDKIPGQQWERWLNIRWKKVDDFKVTKKEAKDYKKVYDETFKGARLK